jgi:putative ubiquitin-RnfH superfamily antitoxin RatB of RatAB toxin-antitoxin module
MKVEVAIALPGRQEVVEVELPEGACAREAVDASGIRARFAEMDLDALRWGIWSRPCKPDARLREGDRVEIYRPLAMDAKAMRRARIKPSSPRSRSGR